MGYRLTPAKYVTVLKLHPARPHLEMQEWGDTKLQMINQNNDMINNDTLQKLLSIFLSLKKESLPLIPQHYNLTLFISS